MKIKKAFTLIEIALVLATISILLLGIIQGSKLIDKAKLSNARKLTDQSPVQSMQNDLVLWLETTINGSLVNSNGSFDVRDGDSIQAWRNVIDELSSVNASQTTALNQPKYSVTKGINGIPTIGFAVDTATIANSDFFNLPNGTVPFENSAYSIFFVSSVNSLCTCGLLGSGSYGTNNQTNAFRYVNDGRIVNYWWNVDIFSATTSIVANRPHILYFTYNLANRSIFINGTQSGVTTAASNRASTSVNNTVGKTGNAEYLDGDIGEVIIFNRALTAEERKNIEVYLSKKWRIPLN